MSTKDKITILVYYRIFPLVNISLIYIIMISLILKLLGFISYDNSMLVYNKVGDIFIKFNILIQITAYFINPKLNKQNGTTSNP